MGSVFKKDGKYFLYAERTTHTGTHRKAEWVDDLQKATVFSVVLPLNLRTGNELDGAERLEATETRTVLLMSNMGIQGPPKAVPLE